MGRLWRAAVIGAFAVVAPGTFATAADVPEPPVYTPPPPAHFGGWYLRGHIGMASQSVDRLDNALFDTTDIVEFLDEGHFDAATIFGLGFGYRFNDWFRFDLTGEYRGKAHFSALDRYETIDDSDPDTFDGTNDYTAKKSEWLFLANAYWDVGTWHGIAPYVGGGIGASRNTISSFRDVDVTNDAVAFGDTDSKWNFAWALHAGASFQVTRNMFIDLGYSFVSLGDAQSGDLIAFDGTNDVDNPMEFEGLTSHDVKLGVRWEFAAPEYYEPAVVKY